MIYANSHIRLIVAVLAVSVIGFADCARGDEPPVFEKDVLPIFTRYCFNCHGKSSPQLGLDLRSARLAMRGSQNGAVIVPGSLEKSLLWKKVSTREMPLAIFKLKLSDAEIATIRKWIEAGAPSTKSTELPADVQAQFAVFERDIKPILTKRCVSCHGVDAPEAGLDLRSLKSLVRGSKKGPVIVEGFSDKSVLIRKVASRAMPPADSGSPLTADEIQTITRWIDTGRFADFVDVDPQGDASKTDTESPEFSAEARRFWAFQKPVALPPPNVESLDRIRTPIDRFVLAKLESKGLAFSRDASKLTLMRRAYFDLTGLPPSPAQAQRYLADDRSDAYERLIDSLLASPHYGERWGRYWLDVVGYVDTAGKDFNPTAATLSEGYWRYRDYVIEATNKDTPWDRFLTEQIAGDELVDWRNAKTYTPKTLELLTATGYLRNVLDATDEDISDLPFDRYEALFKLMERVSTSTLGMTLACARCHSHKFDPIPQTDYYRFLSLFTSAYNPSKWLPPKQRHLFHVSESEQAEIKRQKSTTSATIDSLNLQLVKLREGYRSRLLPQKLGRIPESIRADVEQANSTAPNKRTPAQKKLVEQHAKSLAVTEAEIDAALSATDRKTQTDLDAQIRSNKSRLAALTIDKVQALWDVGEPPTIRLLHRGDVDFAGPIVQPGFLSVLSPPGKSAAIPSPNTRGKTTGLRLAFAEWLTNPEHPLTARVIVNRLWQHHFGKGIVDTPGNFGATGSPPTHPALLDWLTVEFMRQGWSAKRLHQLIMTSTVYRQSSKQLRANETSVDPGNRLLWRMNLRRLDAEALRDSVIAVSGQANYALGGPPIMLQAESSGLQSVAKQGQRGTTRRSVYLLARRSNPLTFLQVFDYPVIDVNCTRRSASATPLQSLTMINSEFLTASAAQLARHVDRLCGADASPTKKVETAYWLTFSRNPSVVEAEASLTHLKHLSGLYAASGMKSAITEQRAFENFVHMLQCSNEFLYVD
ncbi:MAG: PSD1 and planctomycete cytochrome C domain-containing protein [Planctomycetota bacterium]|nr:PSD1 and planctomycete cytochrome C domain-containing protein [Planctomycetota bacterium]